MRVDGPACSIGPNAAEQWTTKETALAPTVLVAFTSRYGSTQEVAEAVAATLRERKLAVDLRHAPEVRSVEEYDAAILGTALYMFRLHKDARRFLSRHAEALARRPIAIFALGPLNDRSEEWESARAQLDKELAQFPLIAPVARQVFGGKFDPTKLGFLWNFVPAMKNMPASDIRDWAAIHAWSAALAEKYQSAFPGVTEAGETR
jgi:menaquinone-dependent protoporphyrinogen oxidase